MENMALNLWDLRAESSSLDGTFKGYQQKKNMNYTNRTKNLYAFKDMKKVETLHKFKS